MAITYNLVKGKPVTFTHDKDNIEIYTISYRPETWVANTEVIANSRLYVPTVANGCMYYAMQGGVTEAVEPVIWPTAPGSSVKSGSVIFNTLPYGLALQTGDVIQANPTTGMPAFTIIAPIDFVIDNSSVVAGNNVQFRITAAPVLAGTYEFIIRISILKVNGIYVQYDSIINLKVV
jgi:hypothetical protein